MGRLYLYLYEYLTFLGQKAKEDIGKARYLLEQVIDASLKGFITIYVQYNPVPLFIIYYGRKSQYISIQAN